MIDARSNGCLCASPRLLAGQRKRNNSATTVQQCEGRKEGRKDGRKEGREEGRTHHQRKHQTLITHSTKARIQSSTNSELTGHTHSLTHSLTHPHTYIHTYIHPLLYLSTEVLSTCSYPMVQSVSIKSLARSLARSQSTNHESRITNHESRITFMTYFLSASTTRCSHYLTVVHQILCGDTLSFWGCGHLRGTPTHLHTYTPIIPGTLTHSHTPQDTTDSTLHTAHCTLHTAHCTLNSDQQDCEVCDTRE